MAYHGIDGDAPATSQARVAARFGVTERSVNAWVTAVGAAGAHLPLTPDVATQITRRSRPGEDHLGRARVATTFGLPAPPRAPTPPPTPRSGVSPRQRGAAAIAIRVLAAVGPLPQPSLFAAIRRSRRFRTDEPVTADQLVDGLLAAGAVLTDDLWHAPDGTKAQDSDRLVVAALAGHEVSCSELITVFIGAGYAPSSARGRTVQTHPLIRRVGPRRYRLIGHGPTGATEAP